MFRPSCTEWTQRIEFINANRAGQLCVNGEFPRGPTGPYMHKSVLELLEEVVRFYNAGGGVDDNKSHMIRPLGLCEGEIADVVALLNSLTGDEIIIGAPDMPDYAVLP